MEGLEMSIEIENIPEFKKAINDFGPMLKEDMYRSFQRTASKEDRILKSTSGFKDRTGRSRRSLFVTATWKPLGLEMGSFLPHMKYLAEGHGTWKGNWWATYLRGMTVRVVEDVSRALKRLVTKYNKKYKDM